MHPVRRARRPHAAHVLATAFHATHGNATRRRFLVLRDYSPWFKYNLTDIAAAIGLHQLRKADKMHERRAQRAQLYSELLVTSTN